MDSRKRSVFISIVGIIAAIGLMVGVGFGVARRVGDGVRNLRRPSVEQSEQYDDEESSQPLTSSLLSLADLRDFNAIYTGGGWSLTITQGDEFAVDVSGSDKAMERMEVFQRGETLRFELTSGIQSVTGNLRANVVLPDLERLEIDGAANVDLNGLDVDSLDIIVNGAASINAHDGRFEDLSVDSDGAGSFKFGSASVVNAHVEMDGVSTMNIRMAGGDLTGVIRGAGEVTFSGDVSDERIRVEGLGRVRRD